VLAPNSFGGRKGRRKAADGPISKLGGKPQVDSKKDDLCELVPLRNTEMVKKDCKIGSNHD